MSHREKAVGGWNHACPPWKPPLFRTWFHRDYKMKVWIFSILFSPFLLKSLFLFLFNFRRKQNDRCKIRVLDFPNKEEAMNSWSCQKLENYSAKCVQLLWKLLPFLLSSKWTTVLFHEPTVSGGESKNQPSRVSQRGLVLFRLWSLSLAISKGPAECF